MKNNLLEITWEKELDIDTISVKDTPTKLYSVTQNRSAYINNLCPHTEKHSYLLYKKNQPVFTETYVQ